MTTWRNQVFDAAKSPNLEAVVAFGRHAQTAVSLWPGATDLTIANVPHPSSRSSTALLDAWHASVLHLRGVVTPDADAGPALPNYDETFGEADYSPITVRDLPFGVPARLGNDAWSRAAVPRNNNRATGHPRMTVTRSIGSHRRPDQARGAQPGGVRCPRP